MKINLETRLTPLDESARVLLMKTTNSTRHSLTVDASDGATFNPVITVADCGTWRISGHEAMRAAMGPAAYLEWQADAWAIIRGK